MNMNMKGWSRGPIEKTVGMEYLWTSDAYTISGWAPPEHMVLIGCAYYADGDVDRCPAVPLYAEGIEPHYQRVWAG